MSEAYDAGDDAPADDLDLSNVPMDDAGDDAPADDGEDAPQQAQARAPLPVEELQKRYDNTRTALQEERRARRDADRRIAALEAGQGGEGRAQQRREAEPEAEIDPEVDPLGALKQMRAKMAAYEAAERQETQTQTQRQAQERTFARVEAQLADHEADFREDHPDYDEAAKHYSTARAQELAAFGLAPPQIVAVLREEFTKLAQTAINARKNPAAVVYEMAKGRGYGAKGGQAPAERDAAGRFKPALTGGKLDTVANGQRATSPLGRAGGRPNPGLDARTIGNINIRDKKGGEAFDKAFAAYERQAKAAERGR